jgi:hypothetical protein
MKTVDQILDLYKERSKYYSPLQGKQRVIQSIYNGTMEVPLPDLEDAAMPFAPNLLAQGIDQMSGRITSTNPNISFASAKPGVRSYDRRAQNAKRALSGWWQQDRLPMKMRQRGRHLIAYGMSPTVVRWDWKNMRPTWQTRHPLEAMPSTDLLPGQISPQDCLFVYRRSAGWMRASGYANQLLQLTQDYNTPQDSSILLIEYLDASHTTLIAAGYHTSDPYLPISMMQADGSVLKGVILEQYPNPIGMTPVSMPMRVTLDGAQGQFDNMIGMYYQQAKLMALEVIAVEKGIFPDTYLVSRPGEVGRFLDGPHDGRSGMVNVVAGGDIREVQSQPGYLTNPTIDRLERNQRITAGIPAEFGGESGSNIRTGRRGDAVLSAVIDYPVAEAQETFAYALEVEDRIAMELCKAYDGNNKRTIYVGTGNASRPVTYIANDTFENTEHVVSYPATGSDLNQLIIGIGQRVGLGIMSKETAASLDPYIDNPEVEKDNIVAEGLQQALVAGLQQQAASGAIPPLVLSKVMKLVRDDKMELAEAFNKVTEDAMAEQEAQQAQAEMGQPSVDAMTADATVAAMAGPQAAVQGPNPSQQNLGQLLNTLRRGARV